MKIHNKLAKTLLRKKDFTAEINTSKNLRTRRLPRNKNVHIEYVYTNNELEFILNKDLRDITNKDIMSDPFLFLMVTEESLEEWLDLHKVDKELFLDEYKQVEIVSDIVSTLDMYFDDDFVITFENLEEYGELSKIDKIILRKLYLRSLFVENEKSKNFYNKSKKQVKKIHKNIHCKRTLSSAL